LAFVGFALWTLRVEEAEDGEVKKSNRLPMFVVAMAFFIGELGDKTQLTAIVLAADAEFPLLILLGTVTGMVITGGLGIYVGSKLGEKIPEFAIKIVAATVFMFFGILKLFQYVPDSFITTLNVVSFTAVISVLTILILRPTLQLRRQGQVALKIRAQELQVFYSKLNEEVHDICLGTSVCGNCKANTCVIGATKALLNGEVNKFELDETTLDKKFNNMKLISSLKSILDFMEENEVTETIVMTKNNLEMALFKQIIKFESIDDYLKKVKEIDLLSYKLLQS
jgi:hypothetical protein